jgi:hypothetical protein
VSETSDPRNFNYVTVGFATDIRSLPNPFKIETPFGFADTVSLGNVFEENEALRERNEALEALVEFYQHGGKTLDEVRKELDL